MALQVDPTPAFRLPEVVSDHIHPDAIEPGQAVGAIQVVSVSDPESLHEDIGCDVRSLAHTYSSAGKAVDGIVVPREDLSEP